MFKMKLYLGIQIDIKTSDKKILNPFYFLIKDKRVMSTNT